MLIASRIFLARNETIMKRVAPTFVEIDLEALRHNYRQLRRRVPSSVKAFCVVKSNAYGHGAPRVAKALQDEGADFFGVGTVDEAIELREAGIRRPVLVLLGIIGDESESLLRYQLTPVIYDLETAAKLNRYAASRKKKISVHIKIDTGMTRLGVLPQDFENFFDRLKSLRFLAPQGLLTHLAEAGERRFTSRQIRIFEDMRKKFRTKFCHVANSQAAIDGLTVGADGHWLARFGIALYGSYPLQRDRRLVKLKPVLSWKTRLIAVKRVPRGTAVSYNRTFVTKRESRIGVIPVGYADGYPRLLSNRSRVLVKGKRVPVAGNVCMELTMVDLTSVPRARAGDEVVLIGRQGRQEVTAEELAKQAETISYEIFCRISPRVPRVYR